MMIITIVLAAAILTGLGIYDRIGKRQELELLSQLLDLLIV